MSSVARRRFRRIAVLVVPLWCAVALSAAHGEGAPACQTGKVIVVPRGAAGRAVGPLVARYNVPAQVLTTATVRWDEAGLSVTFECADEEIVAPKRQRDDADTWRDDCVEVFLDVGHTHKRSARWFHVIVSAGGTAHDESGPASAYEVGGRVDEDIEGLTAAVERTEDGWQATIMIPWAGLGVRPEIGDVWGINLNRSERPGDNYLCWSPTYGRFHEIDQWGHIVFAAPEAGDEPSDEARRKIDRPHRPWVIKEIAMEGQGTPWKYDVDILRSPQYEAMGQYQVQCDEQDRLWLSVGISFNAEETTDAWVAQSRGVRLVSEDKGLTWRMTDERGPARSEDDDTLPDGTLVRTRSLGWVRYPRTEIERLRAKGHYVWDLGAEHDYCAIHYGMLVSRSKDGGKTWEEKAVHEELPFFAHFVLNGPLRVLDDGTIVTFAYGFHTDEIAPASTLGGLSSSYVLRSEDGGDTWELIKMGDGRLSPLPRGFGEIYPIVYGDGRIFAMLRSGLGNYAYSVYSEDGGRTWTQPRKTPVRGKHPRPMVLKDGTILVTYQRRFAQPYGVRARFTQDMGQSWTEEIVLRDDIPISDGLHQANTAELSDGTLITTYDAKKYDDQGREWPFVGGTRWTRNYRGPYGPKLEVPPPGEKYSYDR